MLPEGQPTVPFGQRPILDIQTISPGYSRVLRVPLLRGREFTERDNDSSSRICIVNERLARMFGRTSRRWARARIAEARRASAVAGNLSSDEVSALRATLYELDECKRLLDGALGEEG